MLIAIHCAKCCTQLSADTIFRIVVHSVSLQEDLLQTIQGMNNQAIGLNTSGLLPENTCWTHYCWLLPVTGFKLLNKTKGQLQIRHNWHTNLLLATAFAPVLLRQASLALEANRSLQCLS